MYSIEELKALINIVDNSTVAELLIENEAFTIRIRTKDYNKAKGAITTITASPAPIITPPSPQNTLDNNVNTINQTKSDNANVAIPKHEVHEVKSPMIGTFYRSSSPDSPPFVKVGDKVKKGDVLGIIEAMKLFNEIHADADGTIVKVLADNATPVEYDHVLFWIE